MAIAVCILTVLVITLAFVVLHLAADVRQLQDSHSTLDARQGRIDYRVSMATHPSRRKDLEL